MGRYFYRMHALWNVLIPVTFIFAGHGFEHKTGFSGYLDTLTMWIVLARLMLPAMSGETGRKSGLITADTDKVRGIAHFAAAFIVASGIQVVATGVSGNWMAPLLLTVALCFTAVAVPVAITPPYTWDEIQYHPSTMLFFMLAGAIGAWCATFLPQEYLAHVTEQPMSEGWRVVAPFFIILAQFAIGAHIDGKFTAPTSAPQTQGTV